MKLLIAAFLMTQMGLAIATTVECTSVKTGNTYILNEAERTLKVIDSEQNEKQVVTNLIIEKETLSLTPVEIVTYFYYPDLPRAAFELLDTKGRLTGDYEQDTSIPCDYKN